MRLTAELAATCLLSFLLRLAATPCAAWHSLSTSTHRLVNVMKRHGLLSHAVSVKHYEAVWFWMFIIVFLFLMVTYAISNSSWRIVITSFGDKVKQFIRILQLLGCFSLLLCKYPLSKYVFYDTTQKTCKKFEGYEIIIYIGSGIYSRSYEENPFYHWVVEERVLQ